MTLRSDLDPGTRALLRDADPLRDPGVLDDAGLDTDAALRVVLARAAPLSPEPGRGGRRAARRRALQLGAVGVVTVVATVVAVNVGASGNGQISRTLRTSGVAVAPAHAGTLVARVRRALAGTPGGILEVQADVSLRKGSRDPLFKQTVHYWNENDAPHDQVLVTTATGGSQSVTGEVDGQLEYYDQATNTIGIMTPTPAVEAAEGTSSRAQAIAMLNRPGVAIDRNATFDGAPAIELSSTRDASTTTMYLAPGSYTPLDYRSVAAAGAPASEQGAFMEMRYVAYRTLTGAQASHALISLTAQHPSATVVHEDSAAWNAVASKLSS